MKKIICIHLIIDDKISKYNKIYFFKKIYQRKLENK